MIAWAGKSLQHRATLFHRAFPDKKITTSMLQRLYANCNVRLKVVRLRKVMPDLIKLDFEQLHAQLNERVTSAVETRRKIIFVDEVCFTRSTILKRALSSKGHNICIDQARLNEGFTSVIAAISTDNVVEHIHMEQGGINQYQFCIFLMNLRKKLGPDVTYIFMDQLAVHMTKRVKETMDRLKFLPLYNVKYMPDFNAIETVFALVKRWYCQQRLNALA